MEQLISETLSNVTYPTPKLPLFPQSIALCFLTSSLLVTGHSLNSSAKAVLFLERWTKTSKPQLSVTFLLLTSSSTYILQVMENTTITILCPRKWKGFCRPSMLFPLHVSEYLEINRKVDPTLSNNSYLWSSYTIICLGFFFGMGLSY